MENLANFLNSLTPLPNKKVVITDEKAVITDTVTGAYLHIGKSSKGGYFINNVGSTGNIWYCKSVRNTYNFSLEEVEIYFQNKAYFQK